MGCPAAGNAAFVAHYDRVMGSNRTYRITNNADVVPSMLPTSIGCAPWQGGFEMASSQTCCIRTRAGAVPFMLAKATACGAALRKNELSGPVPAFARARFDIASHPFGVRSFWPHCQPS